MTRAFLIDSTGTTLGALDSSFRSLVTLQSWWDLDTFTLTIDRRRKYADQIAAGMLLYLPDEGTGGEVYLIEQIAAKQGGPVDELQVDGRSIDGIALAERLVLPPAGLDYDEQATIKAETAMKHYANLHAGPGAVDANRRIPGLTIEADAARGIAVSVQGRFQPVLDVIRDIGLLSGLGWQIVPNGVQANPPGLLFKVIQGTDRSATVIFSFDFEMLDEWSELTSLMDSKQIVYVAGQGEGAARDFVMRGAGAGFGRREAFIDARDVDLGRTDILTARGDAFLAGAGFTQSFEAGIHATGAFRYRRDWFLGDIVRLRNPSRNVDLNVRIISVQSTFDESAEVPKVVVGISRPFPTLKDRVAGSGSSGGTASVTADAGGGGASGPIAHSATTGQTPNDHHAEVHALSGADHTGTLGGAQSPALTGDVTSPAGSTATTLVGGTNPAFAGATLNGQIILGGGGSTVVGASLTAVPFSGMRFRWNGASVATIHGFVSEPNNSLHLVTNAHTVNTLTLAHLSTTETVVANRINVPGGANLVLQPGESVWVMADAGGWWRVMNEIAAPTIQFGHVALASIAVGASATATITWGTPFPDALYTVVASVRQGSTTTDAVVANVQTVNAGSIVVRVINHDTAARTPSVDAIAMA